MERKKGREGITTSCEYERESCPTVVKKWLSKYHFSVSLWPLLDKHSFWAIDNGHNINAWNMCWIEPGLKVVDMDINIPSSLVNARVVDLLDDEGSWNWQI
jgi:hypothetical protein